MQLRRFIGQDTPATLAAVRNAFGDDAIILANRRIGEQVEIIATGQLDEAALASARLDTAEADVQYSMQSVDSNQSTEMGDAANESARAAEAEGCPESSETEESSVVSAAGIVDESAVAGDSAEPVPTDIADTASSSSSEAVERSQIASKDTMIADTSCDADGENQSIKLNSVETVKQTNADETAEPDGSESPSASANEILPSTGVKAHIDEIAVRLEERFRCLEVNLWGSRNPKRSLLLRQLLSLGIGAELAIRLAERVPLGSSLDEAFRHALAILKDTLPVTSDKLLEPGVTALHGVEGSGKTTVLMKLATQYVKLSGNQSIVIICADTRRIGAYESLQVFGRLIGVPVVQAHENAELDSLLAAFEHKALVLVDHSSLELPAAMLPSSKATATQGDTATRPCRDVLVLSASMQAATTEALLSNLEGSTFKHCVLTHLDSSARLGELFGALIRHHLPVVSWSDTAAVQAPMQRADASVLVATAVAMGKRLVKTPDEEWLMALIQPVGETAQHLSIPALPNLEEPEPC
ncbi:MAG: hypothetical protein V3U76_08140 [Granulosicoccus sp.]